MEYIKPTINIVFIEDLMQTITTSNPKEGDASGGRAKNQLLFEEEESRDEFISKIPIGKSYSVWEEEE